MLPHVIHAPVAAALDPETWARDNVETVRRDLVRHGAVLLRGFRIDSPQRFETVYGTLLGAPLPYVERSSPRTAVNGNVFTSTEYPASRPIFLHNEQSYNLTFPRFIGFYCQTPAQEGGETPLADTRRVWSRIAPTVREALIERDYLYRRVFGAGMGYAWRDAYQVDTPEALQAYCDSRAISLTWLDDARLMAVTSQRRSVAARHPESGELTWFNHLTFFHSSTLEPDLRELMSEVCAQDELPHATYFGDGAEIDDDIVDGLRAAYRAEEVAFTWQAHDLLLLDNLLTAHGRRPFRGERRVLVAMSEGENWSNVALASAPPV